MQEFSLHLSKLRLVLAGPLPSREGLVETQPLCAARGLLAEHDLQELQPALNALALRSRLLQLDLLVGLLPATLEAGGLHVTVRLGEDIAHHLGLDLPVEEASPELALPALGSVSVGLQEPRKDQRFLAKVKASEVQGAPVRHGVGTASKKQRHDTVLLEIVCVALEVPETRPNGLASQPLESGHHNSKGCGELVALVRLKEGVGLLHRYLPLSECCLQA